MTRPQHALDGEWCTCCKTFRPRSEFYVRPSGKLESWCKACRLKKAKERRDNNPDVAKRSNEYQQRYYADIRTDPVALAAYNEKHRNRRKCRQSQ